MIMLKVHMIYILYVNRKIQADQEEWAKRSEEQQALINMSDQDVQVAIFSLIIMFLAPAVTVVETEGAMDSTSVFFFASFFAYNMVRKKARITIFGMWVTSRWIMDRLKYF